MATRLTARKCPEATEFTTMTTAMAPTGSAPQTPRGSKPSRQRRTTAALVMVVLVSVALYAIVINAYAQSARVAERPELPETTGVSVYFEPFAIRPADRLIDSYVTVVPPASLIAEDGRLSKDIVLVLTSDIGSSVITFEAGSAAIALNREESAPIVSGSYATYPLDKYKVSFNLIAIAEDDATTTWLPAQATVWGDVPGWRMGPQEFLEPTTSTDTAATDSPLPEGTPTFVEISADRAGSTVTIVVLLLIAMVSATALALTVAVAIWTGRRRAEPSLASWGAALLFAMVPLRLNMPDAPPIGVWLDFLVFLWVLLLLVVALAGIISGWLRHGERPPKQRPAARRAGR